MTPRWDLGSSDLDLRMWFLGFPLLRKTMTCGDSWVRGLEGTGLAPPYPGLKFYR
jgi:hypothetical protein